LPEPNFKKFRSDIFSLGQIVPPAPFFTSVVVSNNLAYLSWRSNPGNTYRLQCNDSLVDNRWIDLPGDLTAEGPISTRSEPFDGPTNRFFRVMVLP
jgi:hypothetical protein